MPTIKDKYKTDEPFAFRGRGTPAPEQPEFKAEPERRTTYKIFPTEESAKKKRKGLVPTIPMRPNMGGY
jgi:hypothetical protein